MKQQNTFSNRIGSKVFGLIAFLFFITMISNAMAQSPRMINFQARVTDAVGKAMPGAVIDVDFAIYDVSTGGAALWSETQTGVSTNPRSIINVKLGSTVPLDPSLFQDPMRFLGISVDGGIEMSPRIRLMSVPYALSSSRVYTLDGAQGGYVSGNVEFVDNLTVATDLFVEGTAHINGQIRTPNIRLSDGAADGYVLTSDASGNASWMAATSTDDAYWSLTGNAGTNIAENFLGTTDDRPMAIRVNDERVMKYIPGEDYTGEYNDMTCPSIIGGHKNNSLADGVNGAFIGGGGWLDSDSDARNKVSGDFGAIVGGYNNRAGGTAFVGGGERNHASGSFSAIPGGLGNTASGSYSFAAGVASVASGSGSFAIGRGAEVTHTNSFLWVSREGNWSANSAADYGFKVLADGGIILRSGEGVCVNCDDAGSFALAVNGKIGAREIVVTSVNPWPDYVFEEDYTLLPLADLEELLKTNKHLPGVPSAAAVAEDGIALGAMQARLLEKVEELTLYMIELNRENQELKTRVNDLEVDQNSSPSVNQ